MASLLALAAAVSWGFGDFSGGFASKNRSAWTVVGWSQLLGLIVLVVGLLIVPAPSVRPLDLALGAAAGLAGAAGLGLLYRALADGVMAIVAPVSAATGVVVPLIVGLVIGETMTLVQVGGVVLAVGAIVLATWSDTPIRGGRSAMMGALAAGSLFGLFFVAMSFTSIESGLWPLVPARLASLVLAFMLAGPDRWPPIRSNRGWVVAAGLLDMSANVFIVLAAQRGPLGIVAVLASMYPVVTVAVAVIWLRERPRVIQSIGIVLALAAVGILA